MIKHSCVPPLQDLQAGPPLGRPPEPGLHHQEQLQGARAAAPLHDDGRPHLLLARLHRREGRQGRGHQVRHHARLVLVGHHHHDHGEEELDPTR